MLHSRLSRIVRESNKLGIQSFVSRLSSSKVSSFPIDSSKKNHKLPSDARVVILGGGIIGVSIAYHLSHLGWKDIVLLERDALVSGTTWHAAGLMVTFGSMSETSTSLRKYTKELYSRLEQETGQATGFKPVGFIELATDRDRLEEFRRIAAFNRRYGIDAQEISPAEVKHLFPLCRTEDVLAGFHVPTDGRVNPVDVTMALAKGAKMNGVKIFEGVTATGVLKANKNTAWCERVTGVTTENHGNIHADYVVNCAGMWARQLGEKCGVSIPNQAAEHYYLITDSIPGVDPSWPVIEDPSSYTYIRPESGGLMVGLFEAAAAPWNVKSIPQTFSFGEITPDWDRMGPYLEKAMNRVPASLEVGAKKFFCGPESFTPDGAPLVGEAPELRNYFVAAGLNSIGILTGGGIGRLMAHWIVHGKPDMDVTAINIDRMHRYQSNREYRANRVVETLGRVYACHYPSYQFSTCRNVKRSPIHARLERNGAYFKDVSGWESPDWYTPNGTKPPAVNYTWGRNDVWFKNWEAEHKACREGVVLMDMSFMSKFLVQGRDAGSFLNRLATAQVDGNVNEIVYTQFLNEDGKLEADLTISKLKTDKFLVVATDTMHRHVETWMNRNLQGNQNQIEHATITDVTGGLAQINIQGPKSREVMQALTSEDMSSEAFPFRAIREIEVGFAKVLCVRITYLGELGYELYIPTEQAIHVYDKIREAGEPSGLRHAGLKALASLRMEKGYRDFGHDMDNTDTLLEVGLSFTADFNKKGGFIGKEKVLEQKQKGTLTKRLLQVLVTDPEPLMYHGEILYRNKVRVGDVRAASYGHSLKGAVGLSMVASEPPVKIDKKYIDEGEWEVEINGKLYPVRVSIRPFYDPKNERILV